MKRPSYSLYYVTSAIFGKHFCVSSALMEALIIKLETTVGVQTYTLAGPTYSYIDCGVSKTTSVPVTAMTSAGKLQHWEFGNGCRASKPSIARQVREAHAATDGVERVVIFKDDLRTNQVEWTNRKVALAYLFQGRGLDTSKREASVLAAIHGHKFNLGGLGKHLDLTNAQAYHVFLRCWLKGRLNWDISEVPLGLGMDVRE
jgi:hypothetical protein